MSAVKPKISVSVKTVYGNETIYPECPRAKMFANIAGTKTLTRDTIRKVRALGYRVTVKTPRV